MKLLITGAKGQVGTEIVKLARERGYDVVAASHEQLDISNERQLNEFVLDRKPDVIINAAAFTAVDLAETNQELAFRINADGVKHLSTLAKKLDIPLLHISTDYVFDGSKSAPYIESDPVKPINVYGASKRQGEMFLEQSGARYINLRTSWVFGVSGKNFIKTMMRLAKERDEISVVSDQSGGPTFAEDIAGALLHIVEKIQQAHFNDWGTYHYSGLPYVSWWELAEYSLQNALKMRLIPSLPIIHKLSTDQYPTPAARPNNSRLSCHRFEQVFEYPLSDWQAGCQKLLRSNNFNN